MKKFITFFSLTVILVTGLFVMKSMAALPATYDGVAKILVDTTIERTRALNAVTAVVFDSRGYDTLGESFVLFTAISCSAAILRKGLKGR